MPFTVVADVVLVVHFAVVLFVVGGLLAIPLGVKLGWLWVHGWLFRLTHVAAVALITLQAWLEQHCPLTILEGWLRTQAGEQPPYEVSFVQYWDSSRQWWVSQKSAPGSNLRRREQPCLTNATEPLWYLFTRSPVKIACTAPTLQQVACR